jgi:hypothetical protein
MVELSIRFSGRSMITKVYISRSRPYSRRGMWMGVSTFNFCNYFGNTVLRSTGQGLLSSTGGTPPPLGPVEGVSARPNLDFAKPERRDQSRTPRVRRRWVIRYDQVLQRKLKQKQIRVWLILYEFVVKFLVLDSAP